MSKPGTHQPNPKWSRMGRWISTGKEVRMLTKEARFQLSRGKDRRAIEYTLQALEAFNRGLNCFTSIMAQNNGRTK